MRTDSTHINRFRNRSHPLYKSDDNLGMTGLFVVPLAVGCVAIIIASEGDPEAMPWEHVSVRIGVLKYHGKIKERIPTWDEMCAVKKLFWEDDEPVMQLHPPESDYINCHPCVLHLWRPTDQKIPMPPKAAV